VRAYPVSARLLIMLLLLVDAVVVIPGCADGPYGRGGQPAPMELINRSSADCEHNDDVRCVEYGKILSTRPNYNYSYHFFAPGQGPYGNGKLGVITCAPPAEVAQALSVSGSIALSGGSGGAQMSASESHSSSATDTVLFSPGAATQYVAAASFYNCLVYSSGMYGTVGDTTAQRIAYGYQQLIFDQGIAVQQAATPPPGGSSKSSESTQQAPARPAAPTAARLTETAFAGLNDVGVVIVKPDPALTYTVSAKPDPAAKQPAAGAKSAIGAKSAAAGKSAPAADTSKVADQNEGTHDTLHIITGLNPGQSYVFTATAKNAAGVESDPSPDSNAVTVPK
jgi:hypothetical protein